MQEKVKKNTQTEALGKSVEQNRTEHRYFGHSPKIYYYYNQNLRRTGEIMGQKQYSKDEWLRIF